MARAAVAAAATSASATAWSPRAKDAGIRQQVREVADDVESTLPDSGDDRLGVLPAPVLVLGGDERPLALLAAEDAGGEEPLADVAVQLALAVALRQRGVDPAQHLALHPADRGVAACDVRVQAVHRHVQQRGEPLEQEPGLAARRRDRHHVDPLGGATVSQRSTTARTSWPFQKLRTATPWRLRTEATNSSKP